MYILYLKVNYLFYGYTIFKKLEVVSYLFDIYYEEIENADDFELKIKEHLALNG